jgi:hypothetical protein
MVYILNLNEEEYIIITTQCLQRCCYLGHHQDHHLRNCHCSMKTESSFPINLYKFWPCIQIHSCQCRFLWTAINIRSNTTNHSPPSSSEFKNSWSYISIIPYAFMLWLLVRGRKKFKSRKFPRFFYNNFYKVILRIWEINCAGNALYEDRCLLFLLRLYGPNRV